VDSGFRNAGNLPAQLNFPDMDDQRWRPLTRFAPRYPYEPWVRLEDANGSSLGEAAAWVEKTQQDGKVLARTAYASYLITQSHPLRDKVLDAVFWEVAQKLAHLEKKEYAGVAAEADGPCNRVHVFYYNWYGAPPLQPNYVHWQQAGHEPPNDIGANFYPLLGAYSSSDPQVLKQHMEWIRQARIGVLCTTWWGKGSYEDRSIPAILDAAAKAGLKVTFHLEPYAGRSPARVVEDIRYLMDSYGGHPAFYRTDKFGERPMFYVFSVLRNDSQEWRKAINELRNTKYDSVLIAQTTDPNFIVDAGFDGGYNYNIIPPFRDATYYEKEWLGKIGPWFAARGKLFIPSVGPGYLDDRAVPKGFDEPPSARTRDDGTDLTYKRGWQTAIQTGAQFVTITSFNEWHEGSQIEPAVERISSDYCYPGFRDGPLQYIRLTAEMVSRFEHSGH
jgi:glycoprotein endo-alpha-1,2-mannosidase